MTWCYSPVAQIEFQPDSYQLEPQHLVVLRHFARRVRALGGGWLFAHAAHAENEARAFHVARQRMQIVAQTLYRFGVPHENLLMFNHGCHGIPRRALSSVNPRTVQLFLP